MTIRYLIKLRGGYLNDILHNKLYSTTEKLSAKRFQTEQLAREYMTKYLIDGKVVTLELGAN